VSGINAVILAQVVVWGPAMAKILVAGLLGGLIGLERLLSRHPAGVRTNMVIAIASCLFTILSIEGFPLHGSAQDTARIASQIVTGVGFLGAGVLVHSGSDVHGLTTAAAIWLVAAIGMSVGTGNYFLASFTTVVVTLALALLSPVSEKLEQRAKERHKRQSTTTSTQTPTSPEANQTDR